MEQPLISIIVPVYKVEEYLDTCVESILGQTYRNIELILVDDGSPDRCPAMCDEWARKDARVKVIHKKNGGASAARNAGLKIAQGIYIGFADSDDFVAEDMYEILLEAIRKTGKKIASCASMFVNDELKCTPGVGKSDEKILRTDEAVTEILEGKIGNAVWCKLFAREIFDDIAFPEGEVNEEIPLVIPMLTKAQGMVHTGKELYFYRGREGSITNTYWKGNTSIVYKNLCLLEEQIHQYGLKNVRPAYEYFAAKSAFSVSLCMDKNYDRLNDTAKADLKKYLGMMRKYIYVYLTARTASVKDKILYVLVACRLLRPVYKLCGRL